MTYLEAIKFLAKDTVADMKTLGWEITYDSVKEYLMQHDMIYVDIAEAATEDEE